jgi:hypothetical protein
LPLWHRHDRFIIQQAAAGHFARPRLSCLSTRKGLNMRGKSPAATAALVGLMAIGAAFAADAPKGVPLFDGKTFTGWEGDQKIFRIEDGAIVGGNMKEKVARNEFLTATKEYGDFELRLKVRLKGADPNGGIQFRSRRIPNHNEMIGYQADLGQQYWGVLYDESRRKKVLAVPDKKELEKVIKRDDWNEYVIRCEGRHIRQWFNGLLTVDYTEPDEKIEQKGLIGVQIHAGQPSEAWYKDIVIEELTPGK